MSIGRFLIIDNDVSTSSKRCFSCKHYGSKKRIVGVDKFCAGYVMKIDVDDNSFCEIKEKEVSYDGRCSNWKLDKKVKAFMKQVG